jgi:hypothetical protein
MIKQRTGQESVATYDAKCWQLVERWAWTAGIVSLLGAMFLPSPHRPVA